MISPFDLYNRFATFVNTYQGGFFRPQTDFERASNDVYNDIWNEYTDNAEKIQKVKDNLAPFVVTTNVIVSNANSISGTAEYPKDYGRFSSARILVSKENKTVPDICLGGLTEEEKAEAQEEYLNSITEYPVELIDNSRWAACTSHITKAPTLSKPKITQKDNGFKVAPRGVSVIVLEYYKKPEYVKFAYTLSDGDVQTGAGDQIIYNEQGSGKFLFNETMINEFLIRLGERYSLFTREQFLLQGSQVVKNN